MPKRGTRVIRTKFNGMNERNMPETPFDLLTHYSVRSRACALSAPTLAPFQQQWTGIGFSLGADTFLVSMDDISEIINLPTCTKIPRTKSFVRGVANVRGSIIPVVDLNHFFQKGSSRVTRLRRLLVIEYGESYTGLVVDDILGMQHFPLDGFKGSIENHIDEVYKPFLSGTYTRVPQDTLEEERWPVFDLGTLLADERLENLSM